MGKYIVLLGLLVVFFGCCHQKPKDAASEDYVRHRSVKLMSPKGSCSGEQVRAPSGIDYILSAGHCRGLADADGTIMVQDEDFRQMRRKVIAEDENSDLLLLEGLPNVVGLEIGEMVQRGQHVRTFTHGRGMNTYKTEGVIIQEAEIRIGLHTIEPGQSDEDCKMPKNEIHTFESMFGSVTMCLLKVKEIVTTAEIVPGSSGGMIVDDEGKLIGVASATDTSFGYIVRVEDINAFVGNY